FRLGTDVLARGPVDLFFIEFAVNDDSDAGHARRECLRGMEGIVRQVRRHNPNADMVITHFVSPRLLAQLQAGRTPVSIRAHDDLASHYQVSTIHLAKEIAEQITAGKITWRQFGGTHPGPFGNRICADMIERLLGKAWSEPLENAAPLLAHAMPDRPLEARHYGNGRFVDPGQATLKSGWEIRTPDWKTIAGGKRSRFTRIPMLCGHQPGSGLTLKFSGTAVGAYVVAGPDAGVLEARVDGGEFRPVNLYHRYSKGLHYPRTVMFATDLSTGDHVLTLRIAGETSSGGHAVRIMKFVAN
ncbi:MAG: SGNH/GDSL hydrolase family protein, partial [Planctomycetaceae bacterium]